MSLAHVSFAHPLESVCPRLPLKLARLEMLGGSAEGLILLLVLLCGGRD
jgi:hypothetical protein